MDGLPTDVVLDPLVGARVSQLCFAEHQLIINFDIDARFGIECDLVLSDSSGVISVAPPYADAARILCGLLGRSVLGATREQDGGLLVEFEGRTKLKLVVDSTRYESFQVNLLGEVYVA